MKTRYFRIVKYNRNSFLVQQRHTIFFFVHFWDKRARILEKNDWSKTWRGAYNLIAYAAQKKNFRFKIIVG